MTHTKDKDGPSWAMTDREFDDEIKLYYTSPTDFTHVHVHINESNDGANAVIILAKDEAIAFRDALNRHIEAMP